MDTLCSKTARKESLSKGLCHQFLMDIQIVISAMDKSMHLDAILYSYTLLFSIYWTIAILEGRKAKGSSGLMQCLRHNLCPYAKARCADVSFSERQAFELIPYFNLEVVP